MHHPALHTYGNTLKALAVLAVVLALVTVDSRPAFSDVLADQPVSVDSGRMVMQKFAIYARAYVTATFASGLNAYLMNMSDCDAYLARPEATGPPQYLETSNRGSMGHLLSPGTYCVMLINGGGSSVQGRLLLTGERR